MSKQARSDASNFSTRRSVGLLLSNGRPFRTVGMATAYNTTLANANAIGKPKFEKLASLLKKQYLDKGKLGRITGQGFYTYPNLSFVSPGFVRNR